MQAFNKFWVATGGAVATLLELLLPSAHIATLWPSLTVVISAALVYLVPNRTPVKVVPTVTTPPPPGVYKP
jgi:hypothetical protein